MPACSARESDARKRLGIPESAQRVLLIQESSHWDTNWLRTSDEYFRERICPIFDAIFEELEHDPSRIFAIESVYFLKRYFETHVDRRAALLTLLRSRRLRLLGASLTTPDTLLPHPESVMRDYLLGQEWLRSIDCDVFPTLAYFPDNFGHSPSLPSLMRAVGVEAVGVTRIDGMHFVGSDWRLPGTFPLPGSTAHQLQKELKTLDFVWRDDSGASVLCHWNAFTYFQGDMLGCVGAIRWNGKLFGFEWRTAAHVARQIDGFVRQLEPVSLTPYLFCPIGCDFNPPIPRLGELVARYNQAQSPKTGTHVLVAGLDDYFELLACHRDALPTLEVDPNPAWMGFYASRPELKTSHTRTARALIEAESEHALSSSETPHLAEAWELLALSNHHDFITGTSPDRIVRDEQMPWLDKAAALLKPRARTARPSAQPPHWERRGNTVHVETPHLSLSFSEQEGGCLTRMQSTSGGELAGPGLDLIAYRDTGGLWRLGHEFAGGSFDVVDRVSQRPAHISVTPEPGGLRIDIDAWLESAPFRRSIFCRSDEPSLRLRVEGLPHARSTVTCLLPMKQALASLVMDTVGGLVQRPLEKLYSPTFWPALARVDAGGLTLALDAPTGVSANTEGHVEWIVARHATKERAFGLLPVLAHPIGGSVQEVQVHDVALHLGRLRVTPHPWVQCDDEAVRVTAFKRAANRHGVIVRLQTDTVPKKTLCLGFRHHRVLAAHLCDARETNLETLRIDAGMARVSLRSRIASLRLMPG
ncbi:MAG: hypothetical protein ACKVPX_00800 [Myxococcaceae bacterium]